MYVYTDFLFSTYYDNYFFDKKIHNSTVKEGNYCEKIALKKCKKIILTSEYEINEASTRMKKPQKAENEIAMKIVIGNLSRAIVVNFTSIHAGA